MEKPVLVIMAAGMGSRYGGLKQIDPIDEEGNLIIDFSIYDAVRAGFEKIIFIIKKAIEEDFKAIIGDRISQRIETEYAYQELWELPEGYIIPEGRTKPYGTGHAVLCCRNMIKGPFAVINADDYYGADAFQKMYDFLTRLKEDEKQRYCMIGYMLGNTLTEHGHVARGICETEDGYLKVINERVHIEKREYGAAYTEDEGATWLDVDINSIASMNMWGFSAGIVPVLEKKFSVFLDHNLKENPLKGEFFLPSVIGEMLPEKDVSVKVLESTDRWYGVTYQQDKQIVMDAIKAMKREGKYPENLWMEV